MKGNDYRKSWKTAQARLFKMVSVGVIDDLVNQCYDVLSTGALVLNLAVSVMNTFDHLSGRFGGVFALIENLTVGFFALDYLLRLLSAPCLYPDLSDRRAVGKYIRSFAGVVDLLSFLPYFLPVFFPAGAAAFRMFRVVRILRLFRINAYYDSLNVITEVIISKKTQLLSSVFIILVLMLASSLCMYSLEHQAQPQIFKNAFSGIWWSMSTLLTVGYGDIYPITPLGRVFGILIAFLGVGMAAIPTGIISAGFVEQYTRMQRMGDYAQEEDLRFIRIQLRAQDFWCGKEIRQLHLPQGMVIAAVLRKGEHLIPRGGLRLLAQDQLVIGAQPLPSANPVNLRQVTLKKNHPWNGVPIRDLDISRQTYIFLVQRQEKRLLPKGGLVLREGDVVFFYTKLKETDLGQENILKGEI